MVIKKFILFLLFGIVWILAANAQTYYTQSTNVDVFGDTTVTYSNGLEVKKSTNIFGDKIIAVTKNGRQVKTTTISTDIFGDKTINVTNANGQEIRSAQKSIDIFGDEKLTINRNSQSISIQSSTDIFGDKKRVISDGYGRTIATITYTTDIFGDITKVATDGSGRQIFTIKNSKDIFGNINTTITTTDQGGSINDILDLLGEPR